MSPAADPLCLILLAVANWRRLLSTEHPIWQGSGGAILAVIIAAILAALGGLLVGNTGAASDLLPGSPTQTFIAPGPTITVPGPTTTVPGPTVTVAESEAAPEATTSSNPAVVHLADPTDRPDDLLTGERMSDVGNIGIDGERFTLGWSARFNFLQRPSIAVDINTNGEFSEFRGRLGLSSSSEPNRTRVQIVADGKAIFEDTVTLDRSHDVVLKNISNVIRLQIKVFVPEEPDMLLAVGDPALYSRQ